MLSKQKSPLLAVSRIRKLEPRLPTALEGLPITLRDTWIGAAGTRFELRPIEASDFPLLESFARRLSFRTRYFRFGRGSFELGADQIRRLCNPDPAYSVHLIVINEAKAQPSIVGFGRIVYEPGEKQSELTLTVSDSWQRRGVGRRLLDHLIEAARQRGDSKITARILATNQPMLALVTRHGFTLSNSDQGPEVKFAQLCL